MTEDVYKTGVYYDIVTGAIRRVTAVWPGQDLLPAGVGESMIEALCRDPERCYFVSGAIVERPPSPVSISVSGLTVTVSGAPAGAQCRLLSTAFRTDAAATGAPLNLAAPASGVYEVHVDAFPQLPFRQRVTLATP